MAQTSSSVTMLFLLLQLAFSSLAAQQQQQQHGGGGGSAGGFGAGAVAPPLSAHDRCEPITIPMCAGIAYNETIFPNLLGHPSQEQAGQEMSSFFPLIKIRCSPDIHLFLCAMYAPVCTILDYAIPPCRALCLSAKRGCEDVLRQFDYSWPPSFDCSQFPVGGKPDELCVGDSNHTAFSDSDLEHMKTSTARPSRPRDFAQMMDFKCPVQLQMPPEYEYQLLIGPDQVVENCGAPCYHNITFFNKQQIHFAHDWIGAWSVVCLFSCLFTLATFFVDIGRFPYPERPIIYLTLCFGAIAVIFLVGYGFEEDIACNHAVENRTMNFITEKTIRQGALDDWRCTLTAMGLYFFLMSGSLWWLMLTVAWFLSAGLKWGQEAIDAKSQLFHTIAWTVPSIQTIIVLVTKKVEGDVLSGVCFVGLWDAASLRYYVLAPLCVYLGLGTIFLFLGFFSLIRIRTIMKHDGTKTDKLERLMLRIGIFSVLYTVPAVALVACYFYEQAYLPDWQQLWQEEVCRDQFFLSKWQTPCRFPDGSGPNVPRPEFAVFLLKYSAILLIGIISGFWVWCRKTVNTWRNFFARIMGRQRPVAFV